jgi:hypothetical protein
MSCSGEEGNRLRITEEVEADYSGSVNFYSEDQREVARLFAHEFRSEVKNWRR